MPGVHARSERKMLTRFEWRRVNEQQTRPVKRKRVRVWEDSETSRLGFCSRQPGFAGGVLMALEASGIDARPVLETSKSHLIGLELNVFQESVG